MARKANTTFTKTPKQTRATTDTPVIETESKVSPTATQEITNDTMVACRCGAAGNLIYKSSLNKGYVVEWNGHGDVQELEYRELVAMRGNQRRFFEENWILIDDPAVIKKLGVERYYKNSLTIDDFDEVFKMPANEITEVVPSLPGGTKDAITVKAQEMIQTGELDSRSTVKALSDALGVDLEETI